MEEVTVLQKSTSALRCKREALPQDECQNPGEFEDTVNRKVLAEEALAPEVSSPTGVHFSLPSYFPGDTGDPREPADEVSLTNECLPKGKRTCRIDLGHKCQAGCK